MKKKLEEDLERARMEKESAMQEKNNAINQMQEEMETMKNHYQTKQSQIIEKLNVLEKKEVHVENNGENLDWLRNTIGSLNAEVANLRIENKNLQDKNLGAFQEMREKIDSLSAQNENILRNSVNRLPSPKPREVKMDRPPSFSPPPQQKPMVHKKQVHYYQVRFIF